MTKHNGPGCCSCGTISFTVAFACGNPPMPWPTVTLTRADGTVIPPSYFVGGYPHWINLPAGTTYTASAASPGARWTALSATIGPTARAYGAAWGVSDGFVCCGCSFPLSRHIRYTDASGPHDLYYYPGPLSPCGEWSDQAPDSYGNFPDNAVILWPGSKQSTLDPGGWNTPSHLFHCPTDPNGPADLYRATDPQPPGGLAISEVF